MEPRKAMTGLGENMTDFYTQPFLKALAQQYEENGKLATAEILRKLATRRGPKPKKQPEQDEQDEPVYIYNPLNPAESRSGHQ
jgi:hypothetical protein